jgi:hypothetical protein
MGRDGSAKEGARQRLARRRQKARAMHEAGRSVREIAQALGVSVSTAWSYLQAPKRPGPPPPPRGNQRARTHGVWSAPTIAELQARHRAWAAERWPFLAGDEIEPVARLGARIEQAASYEASHGAIAGDRVRHVSTSLVQWESKLAKLTAEHDAEAERRAAERGQQGGEREQQEWSHLAALAEAPAVSALVRELRGRPWGLITTDPVLMGLAREALREMEGRPRTPDAPEPEPGTVRPALGGRPARLALPAAPGDLGEAS